MDDRKTRLMTALAEIFETDISSLNESDRLVEDLNISSMQTFMVAAELSEIAGSKVSYKQVKEFDTLGNLLHFAAASE